MAAERVGVVILDVAGVPTMDTIVADSLIKTAASVRLLGAATVLTGISASAAKTMVQLGIDVTALHTRRRLSEGIDLALEIMAAHDAK